MEYIHDTTEFYSERPSAVTLGKFDGFHRGHRKLLKQILALQRQGYYGIVFTIAPENRPVLLLPEEKRHLLETMGIDCMLRCPFVPEILSMEPENFVRDVLCRGLKAKYVVVGTDFHFGHNRRGDVSLLNALQERYGYRLIVVEKEQYQGREISSTFVREALASGNMRLVENLLGNPYPVEGVIRHGRHLGHTLGMPTINLVPAQNKLLPPFGVYYSEAMISADSGAAGLLPAEQWGSVQSCASGDSGSVQSCNSGDCGRVQSCASGDSGRVQSCASGDSGRVQSCNSGDSRGVQSSASSESSVSGSGRFSGLSETDICRGTDSAGRGFRCPGITNIGRKPTVDGSFAGAETYLYGVDEDLYGRFVRILLHDFRRAEQKFSSVDELKAQMQLDIRAGAKYAGVSLNTGRAGAGQAGVSLNTFCAGAGQTGVSLNTFCAGAEQTGVSLNTVRADACRGGLSQVPMDMAIEKDGGPGKRQEETKASAADFPGGQSYES